MKTFLTSNVVTVAPTVSDDITAGYSVGSTWLNTTTGSSYVLKDNTAGAAVWAAIGSSVPADGSITNAKLANMATLTFKGNNTGAGAVPLDLTTAQAAAILPTFIASGASHAKGLVPDPGATAGTTKYLREDGTFTVPPGGTYSTFVASGGSHAGGLVPDPGATAGTTKFLREDATFATPPGSTYATFVASGGSHAGGLVPDPGATAGTTKFLREDATFAVPPGSGGASTPGYNYITNGNGQIAQRANTAGGITTYGTAVFGTVDRWKLTPIGSGAGLLIDFKGDASGTATNGGAYGTSLLVGYGSYSDAGTVFQFRQIIPSKYAKELDGKTVSITATLKQNTGGSIPLVFKISKAGGVDSYGSLTNIHTSSSTSVPTATATVCTSNAIAITAGDALNGLVVDIEVTALLSNRTIFLSDVALRIEATASAFTQRPFYDELLKCMEFYEKSFPYSTLPAGNAGGGEYASVAYNGSSAYTYGTFRVEKYKTPTLKKYNPDAATADTWEVYTALNVGAASGGATTVVNAKYFVVSFGSAQVLCVRDWTADAEY